MYTYTNNHILHYKFYFSLFLSLSFSFLAFLGLLSTQGSNLYFLLHSFIYKYYLIHYMFIFTLVTNNIYQIYAHVFTATKFLGYMKIVPHGSRDRQTLLVFTISNFFDILGWFLIFIYMKHANYLFSFIAAVHFGTGIISFIFQDTFQKYYIENGKEFKHIAPLPSPLPSSLHLSNLQLSPLQEKDDLQDNFSYRSWRLFRTAFVIVDAVARNYFLFFYL